PRASSGCARRGRSRRRTSSRTAPRASASSRSGRARPATNREFVSTPTGTASSPAIPTGFPAPQGGGAVLGRLKKSNKVGIMLTFQNSDHFRTIDDVNTFHTLGQRLSQLTYNATNKLGSG